MPARSSENESVIRDLSTAPDVTEGATPSGVLFVTLAGPKLAVSFFVGDAWSRRRSPPDEGCVERTRTTCESFGGDARPRATPGPDTAIEVGAGWAIPL